MVVCNNCGGKIEESYSYCPYCGYMNRKEAEKEYFSKMQDVSKDLLEITEETKAVYEKTIKKEMSKTIGVLLVLAICLLGLFTVTWLLIGITEQDTREIEQEMAWEKENFPILDQLYQENDYSGILKFMEIQYGKKGECFYRWEHYSFLSLYESYENCIRGKEYGSKEIELTKDYYTTMIYDVSRLMYFEEYFPYEKWTQEERQQLLQWKEETKNILEEVVGLTEEETMEIQQEILQKGYLSFDFCTQLGEKVYKRKIER